MAGTTERSVIGKIEQIAAGASCTIKAPDTNTDYIVNRITVSKVNAGDTVNCVLQYYYSTLAQPIESTFTDETTLKNLGEGVSDTVWLQVVNNGSTAVNIGWNGFISRKDT